MNINWKTRLATAVSCLLLATWTFGTFSSNNDSDDPQVAAIEQLRDETFANAHKKTKAQMRGINEQLKQ